MKIEIPLPEKISTNIIYAGKHWSTRKKQADLYHQYIRGLNLKPVKEKPLEITYIFTFKSSPLDTSNCSYMSKLLEDGMVKSGVIEDDSPEYVSSTTIYSKKGKEDKVKIIIV